MSMNYFMEEIELLKKEWVKEMSLKKRELSEGLKVDNLNRSKRLNLACRIFYLGQKAERNGNLQLAVQQYRYATALESNIDESVVLNSFDKQLYEYPQSNEEVASDCQSDAANADDQGWSLLLALPHELLLRVVRWVVGSEIDICSLNSLSLVNQHLGNVVLDKEIWRRICGRLGLDDSNISNSFNDWKTVWLKMPHLLMHGCYLGRISYVRRGDPSSIPLHGNCIAPVVQLVQYCRAIRFWIGSNRVAMMMSASPVQDIVLMMNMYENTVSSSNIYMGTYYVEGDQVFIKFHRQCHTYSQVLPSYRRSTRRYMSSIEEQTHQLLEIVLKIKKTTKHPSNSVLIWQSYYISHTRRNETIVTSLNVKDRHHFPSLIFSPVRTYSLNLSNGPL